MTGGNWLFCNAGENINNLCPSDMADGSLLGALVLINVKSFLNHFNLMLKISFGN